jgi:hypothetical protein
MRKTVKHALKRGDEIEMIRKMLIAGAKLNHRILVKV